MGDKTGIEWTDSTWNPVVGCSIISPGCTNCYAMQQAASLERRFGSKKYAGLTKVVNGHPVWTGATRLIEGTLDQPLRWKRPRRIFVNSMSDLFHESLAELAIDKVFAIMALARRHTFQVLTKRPDRMRDYLTNGGATCLRIGIRQQIEALGHKDIGAVDKVLPNVWMGTSVEDEDRKSRLDALRATPAAVRFISAEPLLGSLGKLDLTGIHWVIVGGESGRGARPMHPEWVREIRDQCATDGVAFYMKQWGEWLPAGQRDAAGLYGLGEGNPIEYGRLGKKKAGYFLDGYEHREFPR